jgi:hypothetical protein
MPKGGLKRTPRGCRGPNEKETMNVFAKKECFREGARRCRDSKHRGERHWYRITGLNGWERAARGVPAWGLEWKQAKRADQ